MTQSTEDRDKTRPDFGKQVETFEKELDRIVRFGLEEKEFRDLEVKLPSSPPYTHYPYISWPFIRSLCVSLAYIRHLRKKNDKLIDGLEKIASEMLTKIEAQQQAQHTLESVTLRNWRNNDSGTDKTD